MSLYPTLGALLGAEPTILKPTSLWGAVQAGLVYLPAPISTHSHAQASLKPKGGTPKPLQPPGGPEADITRMTLASKAWGPSLQTD